MLGKESLLDCFYRVVNTPASNGLVYHQILPDSYRTICQILYYRLRVTHGLVSLTFDLQSNHPNLIDLWTVDTQ
jgi:hypothetical protein